MVPLDLDRFRADGHRRPAPRKARGKPARGWFLKGPIPGDWLVTAAGASARALRVGLALWYLAGLRKSRTVRATWETWRRWGIDPDSARKGLTALERAGLVAVDRGAGRCPLVTILERDKPPPDAGQ